MDIVRSFLNYPGGKARLLPQLLPLLPSRDVDQCVELFAGSAVVSLNYMPQASVVLNDIDRKLIGMMMYISKQRAEHLIASVLDVVHSYGLSDTSEHGYAFYAADSAQGLADVNRAAYMRLREDYNNIIASGGEDPLKLYVLVVFGFNNQLRFNARGLFNNPVGKRDFNVRMRQKLSAFIEACGSRQVVFSNHDFRDVSISNRNAFVYVDPPYLISTAVYNERDGWNNNDEYDLYDYLDGLDHAGIRFALSNVVQLKGRHNDILEQWASRYRMQHLSMSYDNANYQAIRDGYTDEVLVTNY